MKKKCLAAGILLLPSVEICAFLNGRVYAPKRKLPPFAACKPKVLLHATGEAAEYLPPLPPLDAYDYFNGDSDDDDDFSSIEAPWDAADVPNTNGSSNTNIAVNTEVVDQITQQREQIQSLMQMVQKQAKNISRMQLEVNEKSTFGSVPSTSTNTLKAMLFIDGTWLYYSLHHRGDSCPINANYGVGWQHSYKVNWGDLPKVVAQELQQQLSKKRWSGEVSPAAAQSNDVSRSQPQVEIVRATCFTSYKSSTDKNSLRVKMFDQMESAGYDMITMETVGKGEKCVDIALAVDMLHYATIPGSMDICILLTGDKDFIPACLRVRQKGVQVAIVSMHRGCNRALNETPHMKDFDIVFLDHHLTNLVVPDGKRKRNDSIHAMEIIKAMYGFILGTNGKEHYREDGTLVKRAESRDLGRYLKSYRVKRSNMLSEIKSVHGGLRHFVATYPNFFSVENADEMAFWVEINIEKSNLEKVKLEIERQSVLKTAVENASTEIATKPVLQEDLSSKTVVELKELLRSLNLPLSGKKADLIERVETYYTEQQPEVPSLEMQIISLIGDYVEASGGTTGSRNIGRYLSANKINDASALTLLKENYGSLASFMIYHAHDYFKCDGIDDPKLYKQDGFIITSIQDSIPKPVGNG
mmetsp:Transcript_26918/g.41733  ORF Transcript_26918/g.41733 Transcript_26918/m.41733 type:complete len:641 (+) Transcript_26918:122-2044(+)